MEKSIKERLTRIESLLTENQKEVLTFNEAAKFTGLSKSYLYKLCANGEIPHFKPRGKMNYFNKSELLDWLQQNKVNTQAETETEALKYVTTNSERGAK